MKNQYLDAWRLTSLMKALRHHGVMSAAVASPTGGTFLGLRNALRLAHRKQGFQA